MREEQFELLLIGENGVPFAEEVINNQTFAYGEPKVEYHVQIKVYKDKTGRFPADYLRFGLFVDGIDVQYWKRLDLTNLNELDNFACSKFWGFKSCNEITSFVFSEPKYNFQSPQICESNEDVGSVKLVVYRAGIEEGFRSNQSVAHAAPSSTTINESSKFWNQPSISTIGGKVIDVEKEKFLPILQKWINIDTEPMTTLTLRYHTKSVLNILKSMNDPAATIVNDVCSSLTNKASINVKRKLSALQDFNGETCNSGDDIGCLDDEVQHFSPTIQVAFLDLTQDGSKWTTVGLKK